MPRSSRYTASRHQKHPPANVACSICVPLCIIVFSPGPAYNQGNSMEAPPDDESDISPPTAYLIEGGVPLRGTVPISGAKNAVLKLMAAAVLCDEPCTITNAPRIADVEYILEVLC